MEFISKKNNFYPKYKKKNKIVQDQKEYRISLNLWNTNGGGLDLTKNLSKKLLLRCLYADIIFLVEPWIEFDFKNQIYISYIANPVNGKLSA